MAAKSWMWKVRAGAAGLLLLVALSVGLRLSGHGYASATHPQLPAREAADTVVFAGDAQYRPFDYVDSKGRPTGYDVELFRAIAAHAGLHVDYRLGPWERVVDDLYSGKVDVVPMLVTQARARRVRFSDPFLHRYHLAFGKRGGRYVSTLDELAGHRVATQVAGMAWEELKRTPGVQLVGVPVESDALLAVRAGRADYAVVPSFIGYEAQRRLDLRDIVPLSPAFFETEYAYAVRADRPELLARIDKGLREATRTGETNRLYVRWLGNLTPTEETWRSGLMIGVWIAIPLLIAAIVLLVWWQRARARAGSAEAQALHLESHDPVTDLANREGFRRALAPMIDAGQRLAVIRIDLLEIGAVEAMAGHAFVDELLLSLARRLQAHSPLVAKVNDRGFMVMAPDVADADAAQRVMRQMLEAVHTRVEVSGLPIEQVGCAGAALFPAHGATAEELMRAASVACEEACAHPGTGLVYRAALAPDARKVTLLTDLRAAIRDRTLGYALQPKLDLKSRRITGAEMLVRWTHPVHGEMSPCEFVPLAERTGVIGEMTLFLVERAVGHLREWESRGLDLTLSVNVSVNDLADANIVDRIVRLAEDVPGRLMLEITETAVMRDPEKAFAAVGRLRAGGLRISLDDFGTGNASLTYLRRLAPEEVKIDRSFIVGLVRSEADQSIVRSTIQLAHGVRAVVTAEGVEDGETLVWLERAGCEAAQGHVVGWPMTVAKLLDMTTRSAAALL